VTFRLWGPQRAAIGKFIADAIINNSPAPLHA